MAASWALASGQLQALPSGERVLPWRTYMSMHAARPAARPPPPTCVALSLAPMSGWRLPSTLPKACSSTVRSLMCICRRRRGRGRKEGEDTRDTKHACGKATLASEERELAFTLLSACARMHVYVRMRDLTAARLVSATRIASSSTAKAGPSSRAGLPAPLTTRPAARHTPQSQTKP